MNTQPLFEVVSVSKNKTYVFADIKIKDTEIEVSDIRRDEFESWLDDSDGLSFTNENGYDIPKYTPSEYWERAKETTIHQDVYDFIMKTPAGFEKLWNAIYSSIQDICKDYSEQQ